jgi:LytS/YehU family sensor histidine kinase
MLEQASRQTLELRVELELTRKYVEIEQVRFGDRLEVQWSVDETLLNQSVPSLIVLPLVENAIRHGLSPKIGTGSLKIVAATEEGKLVLKVEDDGLGAVLPLRLGVGIGNTQERLEALYGGHARLDIETGAKDGFRIRIQLPLQQEGS